MRNAVPPRRGFAAPQGRSGGMGNEKVLESLRRNECVRKPRVGGAWVLAGGSGHPGARRGWSGAPTFSGGGWRGDWLSTWSSVARPPFTCWNSWVTSGSRSPRSARPAWGSPCQRCWAGRPPAAAAAGTSHAPPRPSLAVHAIGTLGQAGKGSHGGMQALGGHPELTAALLGSGLCAPCTTTGRAPGWRLSPGLSELVRRCPRVSCHLG